MYALELCPRYNLLKCILLRIRPMYDSNKKSWKEEDGRVKEAKARCFLGICPQGQHDAAPCVALNACSTRRINTLSALLAPHPTHDPGPGLPSTLNQNANVPLCHCVADAGHLWLMACPANFQLLDCLMHFQGRGLCSRSRSRSQAV